MSASAGGVSARARRHEDRGGDPLDGLVNLFDLGIVLAVAFLLAALSSLDLTESALTERSRPAEDARQPQVPEDAVVAERDQRVRGVRLREGQRVVGRGSELGRVYRLRDGRTIIVRDRDAPEGSRP